MKCFLQIEFTVYQLNFFKEQIDCVLATGHPELGQSFLFLKINGPPFPNFNLFEIFSDLQKTHSRH